MKRFSTHARPGLHTHSLSRTFLQRNILSNWTWSAIYRIHFLCSPLFITPIFSFTNEKAAVEPKTDPIAKIPGFPTINESKYRTYNMDVVGGPFDYTKTSPWRAPGTAPVRGKVLMLNNNNDLYRKIKRQKQKHTPHIGSCA